MIVVRRGDVVLAEFPFTDGSGSKRRPGVVVQSDDGNERLNAVILALVTSNTGRSLTASTQTLIDIHSLDGAQSGLLHTSVVKCDHLLTIHRTRIERIIGSLAPAIQIEVDRCLKTALGLS